MLDGLRVQGRGQDSAHVQVRGSIDIPLDLWDRRIPTSELPATTSWILTELKWITTWVIKCILKNLNHAHRCLWIIINKHSSLERSLLQYHLSNSVLICCPLSNKNLFLYIPGQGCPCDQWTILTRIYNTSWYLYKCMYPVRTCLIQHSFDNFPLSLMMICAPQLRVQNLHLW